MSNYSQGLKKILTRMWKLVPSWSQWWLLWLVNPKFNIGVTGVIFDPSDRILLLKHVYRRRYAWGLPSGWMKRRESVEGALKREVREETGLEIEVGSVLSIVSGFRLRLELILLARAQAGCVQNVGSEILAGRFFELEKLPTDLLPEHREHISKAVQLRQLASEESGAKRSPNEEVS